MMIDVLGTLFIKIGELPCHLSECTHHLITNITYQQQQQYIMASQPLQQLAQLIFNIDNSYQLASINTYDVAIQSLDDLLIERQKTVAQNIDNIINILQYMITQPHASFLMDRAHLLDFVVSVVQKYPKIASAKSGRGTRILKDALNILTQVSTQTPQAWMNPPDGFQEEADDDVQLQVGKQIMTSVDQLAQAIGFQKTILYLQPFFLQYIQNSQDWRYPFSALMVSSQIGIDGANVESLGLIIQWAMSMAEHYHPRVRHAALHLLGQYSQDLSPQFQQVYFDTLVPLTVKLLQDPVPRVVSHTFACMTNFFQKFKEVWKIQNCLGEFLNPIIHYIKNGNTWIKESALSTLASFATTEDAFGPNLPSVVELAFQIANGCIGQALYKQVFNQSIQIISILLASQKKDLVQQHLVQFISLLFINRQNIDNQYFVQAWNRLCSSYEQFTDLNPLFASILDSVKKLFDDFTTDDECSQGLQCLRATFQCFKSKAAPFVTETLLFAKEKFESKGYSDKVRQNALLLLMETSSSTKPDQPQLLAAWCTQAGNTYSFVCSLIQNRLNSQDIDIGGELQELPWLFQGLKDLVQSLGNCLSSPQLIALAEKQIFFVNQIEQAHTAFSAHGAIDPGNEDDEMDSVNSIDEVAKDCLFYLEQALQQIPDILTQLLKGSVQPTTKSVIFSIYSKQIQISVIKQPYMILFCLNIAVDLIQSTSFQQISGIVPKLMEMFVHFVDHALPRVRNGGVYGLSLLLRKVPTTMLSQVQISNILQYLAQAFTIQFVFKQENKNEEYFVKHCKDNVISALGNLLKIYGGIYPSIFNQQIYSHWLSNLPLNTDKVQGDQQQQLLIDFLNTYPGLLIKDAKDLRLVCEIYAKFVMKRTGKQYKEIVGKTRVSLMYIREWALFKESTDYLWNGLSISHRQALTHLIAE